MVIEESVTVRADIGKVWETFTDLTCWKDWSRTVEDVYSEESGKIEEGKSFRFCLRPFAFPINVTPTVVEVVPGERIVWIGSKYGIFSRHEFIFTTLTGGVRIVSRESFTGAAMKAMGFLFPKRKVREMTVSMLEELKKAVEA